MSAFDYDSLAAHAGHRIECVIYGDGLNAAAECVDCGCVLIDFDNTDDEDEDLPINNILFDENDAEFLAEMDGEQPSLSVPEDDFFDDEGNKLNEACQVFEHLAKKRGRPKGSKNKPKAKKGKK